MKVTGPALSIAYAPLLRKKRKPIGAFVAPPAPRHVNVTAGDPAPNPDCTGTYEYLEQHNDKPAWRRATAPHYRIFWFTGPNKWFLNTHDSYTLDGYSWHKTTPMDGPYNPNLFVSGIAIVSAEIP